MSQVEKEKMLLQHRINEYQRKAEQENEKRRNVENEGKLLILLTNARNSLNTIFEVFVMKLS